jgi:hypothetical protein
MYFFWISVPQIYSAYLAQKDYEFTVMLPVRKSDIAKSKGIVLILLELYHMVWGLIGVIAHVLIYGSQHLFIDLGPSFFGYTFIMFGLFNITFLPLYFKTAYYFGRPLIIAVAITLIFGIGLEVLNLYGEPFSTFIDNSNLMYQTGMLAFGLLVFVAFSWMALKRSSRNYEMIK